MQSSDDWDRRFQQQAGWTRSLRSYLYKRASIEQLNHIIEIGCGTGAILADFEPREEGHIFGLDISERFIRKAQQKFPHVSYTIGDAYWLPFQENSFDAILCHFFLLWISDPINVLQEMKRVARSDSSIFILAEPDYGGRIDYPDELDVLGQAQTESLVAQGADPLIGRRIGRLFHTTGITLIEIGILGGQWGPLEVDVSIDQEWQVLLHDLQLLPEQKRSTLIHPLELDRLQTIHHETVQTGERVFFIPTFYAWGKISK